MLSLFECDIDAMNNNTMTQTFPFKLDYAEFLDANAFVSQLKFLWEDGENGIRSMTWHSFILSEYWRIF